jgi:Domain of unknown function (DUF5664)
MSYDLCHCPPDIKMRDPKTGKCMVCGDHAELRELTSAERKACPVTTGVLQYFPDAIMAVARVSKKGNDKHNPGEPLHWARGKSTDHADSEGRHLLTPGAIDPDSGELEAVHKAWRALADLQLAEEKRLISAGIRPLSGVVT